MTEGVKDKPEEKLAPAMGAWPESQHQGQAQLRLTELSRDLVPMSIMLGQNIKHMMPTCVFSSVGEYLAYCTQSPRLDHSKNNKAAKRVNTSCQGTQTGAVVQ